MEQFEADMRIMFDNAKLYNEDDSQIYKDAVILQGEVTNQAEIEKAREDSELQESMGNPQNRYNNKQTRIPLNGIEHKGEIYVVGMLWFLSI